MSAQRTNRTNREVRRNTGPINQTGRFARRTQPRPATQCPVVAQNSVVASPARLELKSYDDSDEDMEVEMEMRSDGGDGEGAISERAEWDDDDVESVPETEYWYADSEGLKGDSSEEELDEVEYEMEEGPVSINLEAPWDRQSSTLTAPSISPSNWRLERSFLDSNFQGNPPLVQQAGPMNAPPENVSDDGGSEGSSPRSQSGFPLGMMQGATTSTADVSTVSALFDSRDDTGMSFILGDAVSFLCDDLPQHLGDHDYD